MARIVSLVASGTQIVCELGWGDQLVGRSHECDDPATVLGLPACTTPRFSIDGSSLAIDRLVGRSGENNSSLFRLNSELLEELEPSLVITQDQCDVCAVDLEEVEAVCGVLRSRPEIVALGASSLDGVWEDFRLVARSLGVEDEGRRLAARLERRIRRIGRESRNLGARAKVACIEWLDPLMISANWVPELVEYAGGKAVLARAGSPTFKAQWEQVLEADPDTVVLMPCGFGIDRTHEEMKGLTGMKAWEDLRAVREGRVFVTDGNRYFNRPGPRLVESVEILAEILSPGRREIKHQGTGWVAA